MHPFKPERGQGQQQPTTLGRVHHAGRVYEVSLARPDPDLGVQKTELNADYRKCPKISNTLFHSILA